MAISTQTIGHCNHCGFEWVLEADATKADNASIDPRQQGDRCPFCDSNNVRRKQERKLV